MKLESYILALSVVAGQKKKNSDRKVPPRHPLQRLWRLYQFSEEIIQLHFYQSNMKAKRIDALRELIKTWLYMAQRETFLRGTKKCGYYNPDDLPHGGPAPMDGDGNYDFSSNLAGPVLDGNEFTGYKTDNSDLIPKTIEIFDVRGGENHRVRRSTYEKEEERKKRELVESDIDSKIASYEFQLDGDFDDADLDDDNDNDGSDGDIAFARLNRDNPCLAIKQVFVGFKKWSLRYIGNCDGQMTHKHMILRSLKFYNEFRNGCESIPIS
jgi:hypothetical protein